MMPMSESDATKWKFIYDLTENVYCVGNLEGDDHIEFVTESNDKPIVVIGFIITSKLTCKKDAEKEANLAADIVTTCMAVLSKKIIRHRLNSIEEIVNEGAVGNVEVFGNLNADIPTIVFDVNIKVFQRRNIHDDIKSSVAHFINALKANEARDYNSMLKYLWLIYEDSGRKDLDRYRFLRNAVSHSGKLCPSTINGLNEHYCGRFELTNEQTFDLESTANKILVTTEANEILNTTHKDLKKIFGIVY